MSKKADPVKPTQKEVQKRYQQDFSRYRKQTEKTKKILHPVKAA
jgi:hypothetical protein